MENILLSDEAYKILQSFEYLSPMPALESKKFPEPCVDYLCENGLIECRVSSYDISNGLMFPTGCEYFITEKGRGYLSIRHSEQQTFDALRSMAASAEEQAKSAKIQAELAIKAAENAQDNAKKAKRDALYSKILSVVAIIVAFCEPFLAAYATEIAEWFLQLF